MHDIYMHAANDMHTQLHISRQQKLHSLVPPEQNSMFPIQCTKRQTVLLHIYFSTATKRIEFMYIQYSFVVKDTKIERYSGMDLNINLV